MTTQRNTETQPGTDTRNKYCAIAVSVNIEYRMKHFESSVTVNILYISESC